LHPAVADIAVTMPVPPQKQLKSLRAEIAAARILDCGMIHERVLRAADGITPLPSDMPIGVARAGLCPIPVRRQRLGCSHTGSRMRMIEAIDLLAVTGEDGAAALRDRIGEIDARIGRIDHARGDAELAHALACRDGDAAARDEAMAQIAETGRRFTQAQAELDVLRGDLIAAIDRRLAEVSGAG
jgi:hypothetical protein